MAGTGADGSVRYTAFISYSHRDAAMGRWLHRRLEGYRLPRRLAGQPGEHGPVPQRLAPIFRDRDELPAAGDLSEKVRAALTVSDNLIVLCSPHSAASPWVTKEIETFRSLHPGRHVFAAIVGGEPPACFPPPLTEGGTEPLAADLRPEGDGRRLALLKLVAGLAGVGLDALVQRDAARRVKRVTWVTAGALAAMLVMAVMTTIALNARAEAQRQRAEAEGLVEFMLTDLRDTLEDVGRLDAMAAVNARALHHYGGAENLAHLPDEMLARRARILHAVGDDSLALHNIAGAHKAFIDALSTTQELLKRDRSNLQRQFEHTKSLSGLGRVHEKEDKWEPANRYYTAAAAYADRLVAAAPANAEYLDKAAAAAMNLGHVHFYANKNYSVAEAFYAKAVRLLQQAARRKPRDRHTVMAHANALGWLADSYYMRGLWKSSLDVRLRQHAIMADLHRRSSGDAGFIYYLAAARRGSAHSLLKLGRRSEARHQLFQAYEATADLTRRDPANAEWRALKAKLAKDLLRLGFGFPSGITPRKLQESNRKHAFQHESRPRLPTIYRSRGSRIDGRKQWS
jgi:hypothetical protein